MIPAQLPADELERLRELYSLELLDTPYEKEFDDIVRIASKICNTPVSTITLIDSNRQWFKAKIGTEDNNDHRSITFCGHAIMDDKLLEVQNALADERFYDNPLVTNDPPSIRYYAGMPLITQNGYKIGTLCVIDRVPRNLDEDQLQTLETLARQVMRLIELRVKYKELKELAEVKNRIISIVGHDVRNPLGNIRSVIELVQSGVIKAEEEGEIFDRLANQVESTINILSNLTEWGKLDVMPRKSGQTAIELNRLTEDCIQELALNTDSKSNNVQNETHKLVYLGIDKNSLHFILRNLIANANKFTENGTITISNTGNTITVSDTGKGMHGAQAAALMNGYHFTSSPGTRNESGTGLGLVLVKDFLRKIDGRLQVESELGRGSRISIILR